MTRRFDCPTCGRNIAVYTMRNGYDAMRTHNDEPGHECSGSHALTGYRAPVAGYGIPKDIDETT